MLSQSYVKMINLSKFQLVITTSVIAVSCAGVACVFLWRKQKDKKTAKQAMDAFNYIKVQIVDTESVCDAVVTELLRRSKQHKALGFDCEWVTEKGRRQPVALLQLSSLDGLCGLFRLKKLGTMPNSLKNLLENEDLYKVGVACFDDAKYLQQDYSVITRSTLDLRHLAAACGEQPAGLAGMARDILNVELDKNWVVRSSYWDADVLTYRQMNYAAVDAHVAIQLYTTLVRKYKGWLSRYDPWSDVDGLCWKYADLSYTNRKKKTKVKALVTPVKRYAPATRTKPLYHNCFMQAPDGEMLCTIDNKKALWYVEKNLAEIVEEDPLTVRLKFEPAGRAVGEVGRYYQLTKENKCVVCGSSNSYIRKNVVPREYRKYFPEVMKDHSSHDVVLLCVQCHQASNMRDQDVRARLALSCSAPLGDKHNAKHSEDPGYKQVRSSARALLSKKHVLPEGRRNELENVVLKHFPDHSEITEELLEEAANLEYLVENADYESHGRKVVDHYLANSSLLQLEQLWREHFLQAMKPKYMPALWSVTHNHERLRVKFVEGRLSKDDIKRLGANVSM